ncbi:PP0621 family protein [Roseateles albus]|uniref:PP0621 family protein n=1 Tax=Roseateles albus TaxID=2987525 RepID=A0ABT5KJ04_9BURK|nr:PP0621 family protein [Roseateles albus]MDC8773871.1 PP0621 family protein [Roseateles albus]
MKYLLLIVVLGLVFSMLARKRARPPAPKPQAPAQPKALNMGTCAQCGLHLPLDEALPGQGGVFCSSAHRASYELEHGKHS